MSALEGVRTYPLTEADRALAAEVLHRGIRPGRALVPPPYGPRPDTAACGLCSAGRQAGVPAKRHVVGGWCPTARRTFKPVAS